jgi:hypothetical protein
VQNGIGEAGREIVQNDQALAHCPELLHYMTADISGSAGDQYAALTHRFPYPVIVYSV